MKFDSWYCSKDFIEKFKKGDSKSRELMKLILKDCNTYTSEGWANEGIKEITTYGQLVSFTGNGQCDFDSTSGALSPDDRVELYCFLHFGSKFKAFRDNFSKVKSIGKFFKPLTEETGRVIKFIDYGCGPGTASLAFWIILHDYGLAKRHTFKFLLFDKSSAMLKKAKYLTAKAGLDVEDFVQIENKSVLKSLGSGSADLYIFACSYLFGSSTLNVHVLASDLKILHENGKQVILFSQNVKTANRKFDQLIDHLSWRVDDSASSGAFVTQLAYPKDRV